MPNFTAIFFLNSTHHEQETQRLIETIKNDPKTNNKNFELLPDTLHDKPQNPRKLIVAYTPNAGFGLFAGRKYYKGENITSYAGTIVYQGKSKVERESAIQKLNNADYLFQYKNSTNELVVIDARTQGSLGRFVNTGNGSKANVSYEFDGNQIVIKASRNIQNGEQFITQYGGYYKGAAGNFIQLDPINHNLNSVLEEILNAELQLDQANGNSHANMPRFKQIDITRAKNTLEALGFPYIDLFCEFFKLQADSDIETKIASPIVPQPKPVIKPVTAKPLQSTTTNKDDFYDLGNPKDIKRLQVKLEFEFLGPPAPSFFVAKIPNNKYEIFGLFAKTKVSVGTDIPIKGKETKSEPEHDCYFLVEGQKLSDQYFIDCSKAGNASRFTQGSNEPNVKWDRKKSCYTTSKIISPGEEVTACFDEPKPRKPMYFDLKQLGLFSAPVQEAAKRKQPENPLEHSGQIKQFKRLRKMPDLEPAADLSLRL